MLALHVVSLGCAKNQVDTERILGGLLPRACALAARPEDADVLLINTCAFIRPARDEARAVIAELCADKRADQRLIVCGCLVEQHLQEFSATFRNVDAWIAIQDEEQIPQYIERWFPRALAASPGVDRIRLSPRHYAYLRIADGCDHPCAFCTIPAIRGPFRSRAPHALLEEARALARDGVRELILIAQDTGAYGRDLDGDWTLARLLRELCRVEGIAWVRVMYLYPGTLTDELLDVMAGEPAVCSYIDLPLQHIDNNVLRAMRRPGERRTRELLARVRARLPDVALRSTFIVGFPGASEAAFAALLAFVHEQRFRHVGVFTYWHEHGTAAHAMRDTVPEAVKTERRDILMTAQQSISLELNTARVGSTCRVLVDAVTDDAARARTSGDAPDVDGLVHCAPASGLSPGAFVDVAVERAEPYDLYGSITGEARQ
jgi:ribosomal protein S12 methylthiotransferase